MIPRPDYQAHEAFVAPARKRSEMWRFILGAMLAASGFLALNQVFFSTAYTLAGANSFALYEALLAGSTPLAVLLLLCSFGCMTISVVIAVRMIHQRAFSTLLGPLPLFWRHFRAVTVLLVLLMVFIAVLPPWDMGGDYLPNLPFGTWLMLLPLSLLAIFVQVSAEEIAFRGYVQQQLAARFQSPLIWMVLPSVLFGLGHYLPDMAGENALLIAVWAGVFGILMADLTARSGSLGPAIAVHFVNNLSALLLVSLPDNMSGLSLYLSPFSMQDAGAMQAWLPVDFALMIVSWLAARLAIRR